MRKKSKTLLKTLMYLLIILAPFIFTRSASLTEPIIIGHTCTNISQVPEYWINKAKTEFRISYGHTSHGSQIVSGMEVLMAQSDLYSFNHDGTDGALSLHDYEPSGDLGNPDRTTWAQRTRNLLDTPGCNRNMIMWSWCGQADTSEGNIDLYLSLMNQLEEDYPNVTFVYMTGHLNGSGEEGNLNLRNNQIRNYCIANNKILFDFADIESYDPDGNYFLDKDANDGCYYDSDGNGSLDANWADEWCAVHPGECSSCSCAHSRSLNCDLKGKAFWWMMARLAGWEPSTQAHNKFYLDTNWDGQADNTKTFGKSGDIPVTGDWNGDGNTNYGVYRPSKCKFYLDTDWDGFANIVKSYGKAGDIPVVGDWDGDGTVNYGIYRGSKFYLDTDWDGIADIVRPFGKLGDIPVTGDWDGDGTTNIGIYRGGKFHLDTNWDGLAEIIKPYGKLGDILVTGNWDGDLTTNYGIYRPDKCKFYLDMTWDGKADIIRAYGKRGDIPVTGDWNGNGNTNYGIFRK